MPRAKRARRVSARQPPEMNPIQDGECPFVSAVAKAGGFHIAEPAREDV